MFEDLRQFGFALARSGGKATAETPVVRIDVQLLAGLRVLHNHQPDVRNLDFARVPQAHGQHFMALIEQGQRALPARFADEIRDDKDQERGA